MPKKRSNTDIEELKEKFGYNILDYNIISNKVLEGSFLSSGSRSFNNILTGNFDVGWVKGRIYELYGAEASGKTTIGQSGIVDCQKKSGRAMFIDAEKSFNPEYAEDVGIDLKRLIVTRPLSGEEGFEMIIEAIRMEIDFVLVDSVASLIPRAEIENDMDQKHMGLHATLMGQGLRKITAALGPEPSTTIVFINQIRYKIGVVFGNPEVRPGGKALNFFATGAIVELRDARKDKVVESGEEVGKVIKAKTIKNKVHPPFKKCSIPIIYGKGIDRIKDLMFALEQKGCAKVTGKTLQLKGYGKMNSKTFYNKMKDVRFRKKMLGMLK